MSWTAPVTAVTGTLLVPLYIQLALRVIRKRHDHHVAVGSGNHQDLETAIRAHGNFAEYVPFGLLLILSAEVNHAPLASALPAAICLVAGRVVHARAIPAGDLRARVRGMMLTFLALVLGAGSNIIALALPLFSGS